MEIYAYSYKFSCMLVLLKNCRSLSVMLWEILAHGRKPYSNMKDEDVLQRVISTGHIKLPPPSSDIPLHDRW